MRLLRYLHFPKIVGEPKETHVGFSLRGGLPCDGDYSARLIDWPDLKTALRRAGPEGGTTPDLDQIRQTADAIGAPIYLVESAAGVALLVCVRVAGGPKTRARIAAALGPWVPPIRDGEHLLTAVWTAPDAPLRDRAGALRAVAGIEPLGDRSRTLAFTSVPEASSTTIALAAAGATPYITCLSYRSLPALWRRRFDWVGPPAPSQHACPGRSRAAPTSRSSSPVPENDVPKAEAQT